MSGLCCRHSAAHWHLHELRSASVWASLSRFPCCLLNLKLLLNDLIRLFSFICFNVELRWEPVFLTFFFILSLCFCDKIIFLQLISNYFYCTLFCPRCFSTYCMLDVLQLSGDYAHYLRRRFESGRPVFYIKSVFYSLLLNKVNAHVQKLCFQPRIRPRSYGLMVR